MHTCRLDVRDPRPIRRPTWRILPIVPGCELYRRPARDCRNPDPRPLGAESVIRDALTVGREGCRTQRKGLIRAKLRLRDQRTLQVTSLTAEPNLVMSRAIARKSDLIS